MKIINRLVLAVLMTLATILPLNRVQSQAKDLNIVTSFYPMYAITSEIVGDLHEVKMINSGKGIHDFEPSAADIKAIYNADIFIYNSKSLESWTKNLEANKGDHKVQMIQATEDLELKKVPGLEDMEVMEGKDESNLYDPHSWLDPIEAGREAQVIADQLAKIDPDNADHYQTNAKAFQDKAQALVDKYTPIFDKAKLKTFVTQHTAFYYLAERFGLKQLGISGISSDQEPSARQLNEVIQFVKENNVKTIFVEPNISNKVSQVVAQNTGVDVVEMSPLESDPQNDLTFLENMEAQLKVLSDVLSK